MQREYDCTYGSGETCGMMGIGTAIANTSRGGGGLRVQSIVFGCGKEHTGFWTVNGLPQ